MAKSSKNNKRGKSREPKSRRSPSAGSAREKRLGILLSKAEAAIEDDPETALRLAWDVFEVCGTELPILQNLYNIGYRLDDEDLTFEVLKRVNQHYSMPIITLKALRRQYLDRGMTVEAKLVQMEMERHPDYFSFPLPQPRRSRKRKPPAIPSGDPETGADAPPSAKAPEQTQLSLDGFNGEDSDRPEDADVDSAPQQSPQPRPNRSAPEGPKESGSSGPPFGGGGRKTSAAKGNPNSPKKNGRSGKAGKTAGAGKKKAPAPKRTQFTPPAPAPSPEPPATVSVNLDPKLAKAIPTEGIPLTIQVDTDALAAMLEMAEIAPPEARELTLEAFQVRLNETFDRLICLAGLQDVQSLWYQEEAARKVLKRFRGRALLADEVGLGKTIEALLVFSEYLQRGMIRSGLILTPTPLVSQWRQELSAKFGVEIPSTDDSGFRSGDPEFWESPFVLASINQAKSKKHFPMVTAREYDIVIVDEAHHLKNRNTLNWKLVNALQKKYLLLLTATPVENNLMELYNLITLLKPGQLKTATRFREEFMTRGDPTDPRNREQLRGLLDEVMIRNTRAVAKLDLPPRFAETYRVDPTRKEAELYAALNDFLHDSLDSGASRMLLKNLLAGAGSSPRAVEATLQRQLEKDGKAAAPKKEIQALLKQCRKVSHTRKNEVLAELILNNPGKLLVFVKYRATLDFLSDFLKAQGVEHGVFHGGLSNAEKDAQIDRFRESADLLLTTEVGGEGRNLQFCHQMVNYDLPWNPMKIEQRVGRIHRIGQDKPVSIFNLCGTGTLEDYILEILDKKINMFEMVIGEIDMILGRMRGERDFSEMVYDIWAEADSDEARKTGFEKLAAYLRRVKSGYQKTKELDEKLFGDEYEL